MDGRIKIILADGHHVVRQGLSVLLSQEHKFNVAGEAGDGCEAVRLCTRIKPNVLILDLALPGLHGLEVLREIRQKSPSTRLLILSMHKDEFYVREALRRGALGYVLKDSPARELMDAICKIAEGRLFLSRSLGNRRELMISKKRTGISSEAYENLTQRERLVLRLAAQGESSTEIAALLNISPRTAETHRANFMRKLGLR